MKIKIKTLVVYGVVLAATFYAGMMVPRAEKSASPLPVKAAPRPATIVVQSKPTTPAPTANPAPTAAPPPSAAAKLSPDDLKALLQDNPAAAAYARSLTENEDFNGLAIDIAGRWAMDDPRGALAWAQGLPAGKSRDNAVNVIFTTYGTLDPAAALAFAQALPDDGSNDRSRALEGLANAASTLPDPAQAAALLTSIGRTESKISADNPTAAVAATWVLHDTAAATQWIGTLPTGSTKDSAILAVVGVAADKGDPATAFTWLRTMSNPATRGTTTTQLITQWAKTDPDAAQAAVLQAYPNNNNGRQATLLGIIQQARAANTSANPQ